MSSFENPDAAFAASAPLLSLLEPALLLFLLAFLTFGGTTGNGHSLHAQFFRCGFIGGGEESRVGGGENWNATQQLLVLFDRRRQQIGITGALIEYFAVDDDLILRFLDFDHLAAFGWFTCLAFPNEFRIRLKHAQQLVLGSRVAFHEPSPRLLPHLLSPRNNFVDLPFGFLLNAQLP